MSLISCLMPTFNRYPAHGHLVEEAVESFLRQDYPDKELLICNDAPGQKLSVRDDRVRIFNLPRRAPFLTDKIQFLIDRADGDLLTRWDDDDISLPWRLSLSRERLRDRLEWRAENYWYFPRSHGLIEVRRPGNTHTTALWRRETLALIGGYPAHRSGGEDQDFNQALRKAGLPEGDLLAPREMFYLYRWGVSPVHLSGAGGGAIGIQRHYERLGSRDIERGEFEIQPTWRQNYLQLAEEAAANAGR